MRQAQFTRRERLTALARGLRRFLEGATGLRKIAECITRVEALNPKNPVKLLLFTCEGHACIFQLDYQFQSE